MQYLQCLQATLHKLIIMKKVFYWLLFSTAIIGCRQSTSNIGKVATIEGYAPVYATKAALTEIVVKPAATTINAGKIYTYGNYIFQNDINAGIHIIDNSNKANPKKVGFLKIMANTEMAVKSNFLYANNLYDLVVFDISNPAVPVLVNRVVDAFPTVAQNYPMQQNVYFECVDASKGVVVNWVRKTLNNPNCYR
jgi:LVIVD repeat